MPRSSDKDSLSKKTKVSSTKRDPTAKRRVSKPLVAPSQDKKAVNSKPKKSSNGFGAILRAHRQTGVTESRVYSIHAKKDAVYDGERFLQNTTRKKRITSVRDAYDNGQGRFFDSVISEKKVERKHITLAAACLSILIIIGSYVAPKSSAEGVIFYPSSCLGGWVNPHNVEGAPQVEGNALHDKFTEENSSVLPLETNADIYCGGFSGEFQKNTKPTKVLVSLSWSQGKSITAIKEEVITGESFASSSVQILDVDASSTVSFTLATSTEDTKVLDKETVPADSVNQEGSSTANVIKETTGDSANATTTQELKSSEIKKEEQVATTSIEQPVSPQTSIQEGSTSTYQGVISTSTENSISLLDLLLQSGIFGARAYAEEADPQVGVVASSSQDFTQGVNIVEDFLRKTDELLSQKIELPTLTSTTSTESSTTPLYASTDDNQSTSTFDALLGTHITTDTSSIIFSSSTVLESIESTSTLVVATTTNTIISESNAEDEAQNNFLQILYTFDGITWSSLGKVNEESIVYRTFEIPVTATTSWYDLSQLQIKVQAYGRADPVPTMYLDGMKVEVLYETPVPHDHPDFVRDTILQDKSDDNVRVISIINSDTNNREIWYTTIETQAEFGVEPGSWVKVELSQDTASYRLVEIYGRYLFWVDDVGQMLWTMNLEKGSNDGMALNSKSTTTISFIKSNGENWFFDYNNKIKKGILRIKE